MRLKALTVAGYKSFANRTRFAFPSGLTAVVGPNGSGKSNVADAVRWVLGEGRASALRARATDDLIFAGTDRRARSGLAEVSIVLDNEDGWLDIAYPEVVITRRAHRDGQATFLVNDSPVRLRDVLDLLAGRLGPSNFTVVGQGVVDRFLTLTPPQRREFIDEAAGIQPLQRRRDRAVRRLAETRENMTRVSDILAEVGPRLRRMERLAERAARHRQVSEALGEHLTAWYAHHLQRARQDVRTARDVREVAEVALAAAHREAEAARAALDAASQSSEQSEASLDHQRAEREVCAAALADARQRAAVARAQQEALEARRAELEGAVQTAQTRCAELAQRRTALAEEGGERDLDFAAAARRLAQAEAALASAEGERAARGAALEAARADRLEATGHLAAERARLAATDEARRAREAERRQHALAIADAAAGDAEREAEAHALGQALAAAAAALGEASFEAARADVAVAEAGAALATAREENAAARAALESLRTRDRALAALAGELAGAEDVAAGLTASGVALHGTIAEVLEVAAGWEAAVAAVLEGRVHGIVVADVAAADRALAALVAEATTRAVVVPLAGGHPIAAWQPAPHERAADDVCTSERPGLVRGLLGDAAFADDLPSARRAVARDGGPRLAATRDGVVVDRHGTARIGSAGRELFAVERERRALPAALTDAERAVSDAAAAVDGLTDARRTAEGRLADALRTRAACEAARVEALERAEAAAAAAERARREREWRAEAVERAEAAQARLAAEIDAIERVLSEAIAREEACRAGETAANAALDAVDPAAPRAERDAAAAVQSALAEARAAQVARAESAARDADAAEALLAEGTAAAAAVARDLAALAERAAVADADILRFAQALEALDAALGSTATTTAEARLAARAQSATLDAARDRTASLGSRLAEARLAEARAEDRLQRLLEQRRDDLAMLTASAAQPDDEGDPPGEAGAGAGAERSEAGAPDARASVDSTTDDAAEAPPLPDDLDATIQSLRRELQQIGAIDREALAAFEETAARHADLGDQLADMTAADRDLREVIDALEAEMATRFDETFNAVAETFARYFPRLFGGGEAELTLVEPAAPDDDGPAAPTAPGIDVLARPPGKRRQPLSLLSGGERSLTAVALTFALLEVSGTPFALLDEVDAALDEANVDRFRACLRDLAERIQIVIITHNRATVQAADAIYGVTMGEDGASRTVSLRVGDVA